MQGYSCDGQQACLGDILRHMELAMAVVAWFSASVGQACTQWWCMLSWFQKSDHQQPSEHNLKCTEQEKCMAALLEWIPAVGATKALHRGAKSYSITCINLVQALSELLIEETVAE